MIALRPAATARLERQMGHPVRSRGIGSPDRAGDAPRVLRAASARFSPRFPSSRVGPGSRPRESNAGGRLGVWPGSGDACDPGKSGHRLSVGSLEAQGRPPGPRSLGSCGFDLAVAGRRAGSQLGPPHHFVRRMHGAHGRFGGTRGRTQGLDRFGVRSQPPRRPGHDPCSHSFADVPGAARADRASHPEDVTRPRNERRTNARHDVPLCPRLPFRRAPSIFEPVASLTITRAELDGPGDDNRRTESGTGA